MEQAPVQIGQFILGKNLGIGAFGKVRIKPSKKGSSFLMESEKDLLVPSGVRWTRYSGKFNGEFRLGDVMTTDITLSSIIFKMKECRDGSPSGGQRP
jgi:hypothetical protein